MIVNPAYAFYAKKEPLPDFNLWEGGVVNVPYTVSNAKWNSPGNMFSIYATGYAEFTVDAKGYSKIKFEMSAANTLGGSARIEFYNSTGSFISDSQLTLPNSRKPYTIDIPKAARISGAKIRFNNPDQNVRDSLFTATLQE